MDNLTMLMYGFIGLCVVLALAGKFVGYGLRAFFAKFRYKDSAGLVLIRDKGNNIAQLHFVNLNALTFDQKDGTRFLTRQMFEGIRFFGFPTVIFDSEEAVTSLGIYQKKFNIFRKNKDTKGDISKVNIGVELTGTQILDLFKREAELVKDPSNPDAYDVEEAVHSFSEGDMVIKTDIPKLVSHKTSIRLTPQTVKQGIINLSFNDQLNAFLQQYKLILILCAAAAIGGCVAAYLTYTTKGELLQFCAMTLDSGLRTLSNSITASNLTG